MNTVPTLQITPCTASATPLLLQVTKAFVRLFKLRAQMDQLLFPEMLGKCFIVNTPSLFSYVWAMFSPLVDERTRSKVRERVWWASYLDLRCAPQQ